MSKEEDPKESVSLGLRPDQVAHIAHLEIAAELVAGIVHELNQPLTAIAMLVCAGQEAFKTVADSGSTRSSELFSKIESQTKRACEITRRLRWTNRRSDLRRSRCNPNLLIRHVLELISPDIRAAGADVRLSLDPHVPDVVLLDAAQVRLVILNLLKNAVDVVELSDPRRRFVDVSTKLIDSCEFNIEVRDTGPGISPGLDDCLFEPFVTSKPNRLGLGLTISRSIVEAHGGRLWFECPPDGGTRFLATLQYPASDEAAHGN